MTSDRTSNPVRRIAAAMAALIGALALLAVPGAASGAAAGSAEGTAFSALRAPAGAAAHQRPNTNGVNWSGYVATGRTFRSVSAAWTVPAVRCNSPTNVMGPWVGLGGVATNAVEQTGMEISCASGRPTSRAWSEMAPAAPVYYRREIRQGDAMRAEVRRTGTTYELIVSDTTRHWTERVTRSAHGDDATAEVVLESPTGGFPDFGTFRFTAATADGTALSAHRTVALDANSGAGFQNHTGPLSKGTFSIRYLRE